MPTTKKARAPVHLPCIEILLDFHGIFRKIHLNQLSDLWLQAKILAIFNRAVG